MSLERARDLLPEYALGGLTDAERAEVDRALEDSSDLRAELAEINDAFGGLAEGLEPITPPPEVKDRLFASIDESPYLPFVADLAKYCDLALEKMQQVLQLAKDPSAWIPGPMPGIDIIHFDHGPACTGADTGYVRMPANFTFPRHRHLGSEINYVVEGRIIDDDGTVYGPGEAMVNGPERIHGWKTGPEPMVMIVIQNGFEPVGDDE